MASVALLLIHGYPFDHTLWDPVLPHVAAGTQLLAPDLPGFGGRAAPPGEPSLEIMAEDLKQLLDRSGVDRAVIAGMSMGGYVALAFAERFPERLAALGLISTQAAADTDEAKAGRRAMIEKVRREGPQVAAAAAIPKLFAAHNAAKPEFTCYPAKGAERAGKAGIAWALEAMARRPDRTALLAALTVPTLVFHGADDKFIPVARARTMAQSVRDRRYVEVETAGHATPLEAPGLLAEALNDLLQRAYGRPA